MQWIRCTGGAGGAKMSDNMAAARREDGAGGTDGQMSLTDAGCAARQCREAQTRKAAQASAAAAAMAAQSASSEAPAPELASRAAPLPMLPDALLSPPACASL